MTDRTLNFVNYIAERVCQVYPDKLIELQAYGYNRLPPAREKVHPNVLIKYANGGGNPVGQSLLLNKRYTGHQVHREHLEGWLAAETKHLVYYNYWDFEHPDVSLCWFYHVTDYLKNLKDLYGNWGIQGETETSVQSSAALFYVTSRALWDTDIDYANEIMDFCTRFYGAAAADMNNYYTAMDTAIRNSDAWKSQSYNANAHAELTLADLTEAKASLDSAAAAVAGVSPYELRVAYVRFAHAYLMYVVTGDVQYKNTANNFRTSYSIMIKLPTYNQLQ